MLCNRRTIDFNLSQKLLHVARTVGIFFPKLLQLQLQTRSLATHAFTLWLTTALLIQSRAGRGLVFAYGVNWRLNTRVSMPYKVPITVIPRFTDIVREVTHYEHQWCKQDKILKTKTKTKIPPEVNKGTSRVQLLSKWTPLLISTVVMIQAQNSETINSTWKVVVSFKIIMTTRAWQDRVSQNNTRPARPRPRP